MLGFSADENVIAKSEQNVSMNYPEIRRTVRQAAVCSEKKEKKEKEKPDQKEKGRVEESCKKS